MSDELDFDSSIMRKAIALAKQGEGHVEPNPMVGCVVVRNRQILATGYHRKYGDAHAEVEALRGLSREDLNNATVYVTLEPCCHFGKTPPCVDLIIDLKPARVVIGTTDPFPAVQGKGIQRLQAAGISVDVGVEALACQRLIAPFAKLHTQNKPWVIAKWAMTLDGRMATSRGDSQWITSEAMRNHAHRRRGLVDAIMVGIGTAISDDPQLTARPPGPRMACRIVIDSRARLPLTSRLVKSAKQTPVLIACGPEASNDDCSLLREAGCEVWQSSQAHPNARLHELLSELGARQFTNVLIDGGPKIIGAFFDEKLVDEIEVYIGGKLVGGMPNWVPNFGCGVTNMNESWTVENLRFSQIESDLELRADIGGRKYLG